MCERQLQLPRDSGGGSGGFFFFLGGGGHEDFLKSFVQEGMREASGQDVRDERPSAPGGNREGRYD